MSIEPLRDMKTALLIEGAVAADLYDANGVCIGTRRLDLDDLDRCSNGCVCTPNERLESDPYYE